ncbi:CocE/NonD family hydrolase [Paracoccus sp. PAR01]|uniref:CocE/NonD family hydrolase n=1 Tax=Paracoccus sp. PAR01 TaxID=2769282 RepID=UPI00177CAB6D|nr:CocE/NonD family hydrolase [Paracoccus sp. PAR01]MBD9528556.1 CocE/NonD family hydrolase [Paracoccus sp. PAR01]
MTIEEHVWIPLADGTRLGARIWHPDGDAPAPAILEYIPYRKREGTRGRDEPMHGYFASRGYVAIRVDMRGTGESDGHMADEYLLQEQDDALEVIAWIAAQDWCDGNVGMMGKSWGGFNSLQVAARRPPALKAIISAYSTDDRFRDDIHYMGGALLNDNLWWGTIMLAYQSRPLDPEIVGEDWRKAWLDRIEKLPFFPAIWASHQRYDDYWKHGSVQEDWSAIECPVLVIGGWSDSYTNTVPRLVANLQAPAWGIIGPWGHIYPMDGVPGPAIGFLQEATDWWDHWLRGIDRGIEAQPKMRFYEQDSFAPTGTRLANPGRWIAEAEWPSPRLDWTDFPLGADGVLGSAAIGDLAICSPQSHGKAAGEWMGVGCVGENPTDQRLDDGGSLNFDSAPLVDNMSVVGAPRLRLRLASDKPVAQLVARLSEILPCGQVTRVSYQVLNLTHRDSHETPEALEPGRFYDVTVTMNALAHRFAKGNRVRVSIGTAYWPMIWPAPERATLTIRGGESRAELPLRAPSPLDAQVSFAPPQPGPACAITQVDPGTVRRWTEQDHVSGETTYHTEGIGGLFGEGILRFDDIGTTIGHSLKRTLTIRDVDPLSAHYHLRQSYDIGREGWQIRIESVTEMRSDRGDFLISGQLQAFENGALVATRDWDERIPRQLI